MAVSGLKCMVIMPFAREFDRVFATVRDAVSTALPDDPIDCDWLKDMRAAGRITDDIIKSLRESAVCVADVTGANPNVMWETGYAMALGRPVILIAQSVEALPFDLKVHRVLTYDVSNPGALSDGLSEATRQTLARYTSSRAPAARAVDPGRLSIAITGSMSGDRARVARRLEVTLAPYIPLEPSWYCGSVGNVDAAAIDFLLAQNHDVTVVGYHRFDYTSEYVRGLIDTGRIKFIDGSVEPVPRALGDPNRDAFLASRADLIILLWDGQSQGTARMIDYYKQNARALLVALI